VSIHHKYFFIYFSQPLYTINCVNAFCSECMTNQTVLYFAIILSHVNSSINPLLYSYHLKDFRGALNRLFTCTSQPESFNRPSLTSQYQQRIAEQYSTRRAFEPKIYIDSPIWKRQQLQLKVYGETKVNDNDSGLNISSSDITNLEHADKFSSLKGRVNFIHVPDN
jgi:hypothetical protein